MIFSVVYLVVRCLLGCLMVLVGRVEHTQMSAPEIHPAAYFRRTFHRLPSNRTESGT